MKDWDDPEYLPEWAQKILKDPASQEMAEQWFSKLSADTMVGSKHHTVPAFYLQRFALDNKLRVRDRVSGAPTVRSVQDLAIKNFYTFINNDGAEDGRIEQTLGQVERSAAPVITRLLSPFYLPRPLNQQEMLDLCLLIAFQIVRGPRRRREIELLADYGVKLVNQGRPEFKNIGALRIVPHPNEHLTILLRLPFVITEQLLDRPVTVVTVDQPLFVTSDEPVIVNVSDGHVRHMPECYKTEKQRRRAAKRPSRNRKRKREIIHFYPTKMSGVAEAEEIALPLSPTALLLLGPMQTYGEPSIRLRGDEALELASKVNAVVIDQAYQWVAASPDHPHFTDMAIPSPGPLIQVCDGGTHLSKALNAAPHPRQPQRLSRHWR